MILNKSLLTFSIPAEFGLNVVWHPLQGENRHFVGRYVLSEGAVVFDAALMKPLFSKRLDTSSRATLSPLPLRRKTKPAINH